ncbi:hypothetical protein TRAPUB_155 [Trametes pubescens]|uniref:Uncharacterized protein n=1 Tax=Trametes pubescens TaxID=154538 RepID=A0A1M2VMW5_TRAPU|nr:hypothetical protein TRAPUB_155 [Trametes pubescens]
MAGVAQVLQCDGFDYVNIQPFPQSKLELVYKQHITILEQHRNAVNSLGTTGPTGSGSTTSGPQTSASGQSTAALTSSDKHSNHTGAIVGGVIGGLAFLLLAIVAATLLYRRMRARRTAPSAEFMDLARSETTPGPNPVRMEGTTTPSGDRLLPLARQDSLGDDDDRPPGFAPGAYADPVLEKVQAAAALREQYERRDSYAAAQADHKEGLGHSEVGHDDERTEVGTEEGYGLDGNEKAGYTWAM